MGGDGVFLPESACRRPLGSRAPDERAVSGDPLRRRLHHARRRQRAAVPPLVRRARPRRVERDPAFADNASRVTHREALAARIEAITVTQPRAPLADRCSRRNDIPCGPINDYAQVFADPQVLAREMVVEIEHPTLGHLRTLGSPIKMSATPPDVSRRAPQLGEHTGRSADRKPGSATCRDRGVAGSWCDHLSARLRVIRRGLRGWPRYTTAGPAPAAKRPA